MKKIFSIIKIISLAENKGLLNYSIAGKYSPNGYPRLTEQAHSIQRAIDRKKNIIVKEDEKILEDSLDMSFWDISIKKPDSYVVDSLKVSQETSILTPLQIHPAIITGDIHGHDSVKAIAFLTSEKGVYEFNPGQQKNVYLSDKKPFADLGEKEGKQYVAPLIPPIEVAARMVTELDKGTQFLNEPSIRAKLDNINEQVSQYKSVPYDSNGITIDKLKDIIETIDLVTPGKLQSKKNPLLEEKPIINDSSQIVD